jgi:hypothetical protein
MRNYSTMVAFSNTMTFNSGDFNLIALGSGV